MEHCKEDIGNIDPTTGAVIPPSDVEHVMDRDKYGRPIKRPPTPDSADKDLLSAKFPAGKRHCHFQS